MAGVRSRWLLRDRWTRKSSVCMMSSLTYWETSRLISHPSPPNSTPFSGFVSCCYSSSRGCATAWRVRGQCVGLLEGYFPRSVQSEWTTSRRGQDSPWKSQSEWQRKGDKWRKYARGVANPRIKDGWRTEQNHPVDDSEWVGLSLSVYMCSTSHRPVRQTHWQDRWVYGSRWDCSDTRWSRLVVCHPLCL